ncbi:MAG: TetR/AcrR family transcriptional regulator [Pseudomonadales bacterium]
MTVHTQKRRRGRPPKSLDSQRDTRAELIRSGLEHLTESGFIASGIDKILKSVGVPKGSFYFYFSSKEDFGHAVIDSYASYFANKLDAALLDESEEPLQRLRNFAEKAKQGMEKHQFRRGCLVGNLGQEVDVLPASYRAKLIDIFACWESKVSACLELALMRGQLNRQVDCAQLAQLFWLSWEGAVSRAKLEQSAKPLDNCIEHFLEGLTNTAQ